MPLDLKDVRAGVRDLSVSVGRGTIALTYRPDAIPFEFIESVSGFETREDSRVIFETLADTLVAWDLTDNGKPYPTDFQALRRLPLSVALAVLKAVVADIRDPNGDGPSQQPSSLAD